MRRRQLLPLHHKTNSWRILGIHFANSFSSSSLITPPVKRWIAMIRRALSQSRGFGKLPENSVFECGQRLILNSGKGFRLPVCRNLPSSIEVSPAGRNWPVKINSPPHSGVKSRTIKATLYPEGAVCYERQMERNAGDLSHCCYRFHRGRRR